MKHILALLLIASVLFISGCQTMHGLGEDAEDAGEWIQEQAK
jgi:predicted small secreted protein